MCVYEIPCTECDQKYIRGNRLQFWYDQKYIGETDKSFDQRLEELKKDVELTEHLPGMSEQCQCPF